MITIKDYVGTIFDSTGTNSHSAQRVNYEIRRYFELAHINCQLLLICNQIHSYNYIL